MDQILRLPAVIEATGLSRTSIWRLVRANRFPQPIRLTAKAIGWKRTDVQSWIDTREPVGGHPNGL